MVRLPNEIVLVSDLLGLLHKLEVVCPQLLRLRCVHILKLLEHHL